MFFFALMICILAFPFAFWLSYRLYFINMKKSKQQAYTNKLRFISLGIVGGIVGFAIGAFCYFVLSFFWWGMSTGAQGIPFIFSPVLFLVVWAFFSAGSSLLFASMDNIRR